MSKNSILSFTDYFKLFFKFDLFKKEFSKKSLSIFLAILLIFIALINVLINLNSSNGSSMQTAFLYVIFGFPSVLIFIYSLFFVFLKAYEDKLNKESYIKGGFVFSAVSLLFYLVIYILVLIRDLLISYNILYLIFQLLIFLFAIYYIIALILTLKIFFKVSGFKITTSLLFTYIIILTIALLEYLTYLIGSLK